MEFLKNTDLFDVEGKAFYNNCANTIDIFLRANEEVDCISMPYTNIKRLPMFKDLTINEFKKDFEFILSIISEQDGLMNKIIVMQAFELGLWNEVVDGFKSTNMEFIHVEQIGDNEYTISSESDVGKTKLASLQIDSKENKLFLYQDVSLGQHKAIKSAIRQIRADIEYKTVNQY